MTQSQIRSFLGFIDIPVKTLSTHFGVSEAHIYNWQRGRTRVSPKFHARIWELMRFRAEQLGVKIDKI